MSNLHVRAANIYAQLHAQECPNCAMDLARMTKTTVQERRNGLPYITRTKVYYHCDHCKAEYDEWGNEYDKDGWLVDDALNPRRREERNDGE